MEKKSKNNLLGRYRREIYLMVMILSALFLISNVSASYDDCEVYGTCKPASQIVNQTAINNNNFYNVTMGVNSTQMENITIITVKESWLTTFFNLLTSAIYNLFSANDTALDNRIISINTTITNSNASWLSTYNQTYANNIDTNDTLRVNLLNQTITDSNASWLDRSNNTLLSINTTASLVYGVNTTANIGNLYNLTALIFANINNNTANIQTLVNSSYVFVGTQNKTKSHCSNITGATSNLCTLTAGAGVGWNRTGTNVFLDHTGDNVGIGTASPDNKLDIEAATYAAMQLSTSNGDASARNWGIASNVQVFGDFGIMQSNALGGNAITAATTRLYIDKTGNVGIGTTSPTSKLDIGSNTAAETIYINVNAAANQQTGINFDSAGTNTWYMYRPVSSTDLRFWDNTADRVTFQTGGNVGIGTTAPLRLLQVGAGIPASVDTANIKLAVLTASAVANTAGKVIYTSMPEGGTYGTIEAYNYATAAALPLILNPNGGSVGIGTTGPQHSLDIGNGGIRINRTTDPPYLMFSKDGTSIAQIRGQYTDTLAITGGTGVTSYLSVNISSGNVGIGTTSPTSLLHVLGTTGEIARFRANGADAQTDVAIVNDVQTWGFRVDGADADKFKIMNFQASTPVMSFSKNGDILIGGGAGNNTVLSSKVQVIYSGTDANRYTVYWNSVAGDLIFVSSDERMKKDFDYNISGLDIVGKLKPLYFTFKNSTQRQAGFLAQEAIQADPTLAWYNETEDKWGLNGFDSFSAVLVKAIQEQQQIIINQNNTINDLKKALCESSIKGEFVELCK